MKISEIQIPGIRNHPRAGNFTRNLNLIIKIMKNHEKMRNLEKHENSHESHSPVDFSTQNIDFRSADAANHVNRDPRGEILVTRRAYIPKIYKLEE